MHETGVELGGRAARTLLADARSRADDPLAPLAAVAALEPDLPILMSDQLPIASLPPGAVHAAAWRALDAAGDPRAPAMRERAIADIERGSALVADPTTRQRMRERAPDAAALRAG